MSGLSPHGLPDGLFVALALLVPLTLVRCGGQEPDGSPPADAAVVSPDVDGPGGTSPTWYQDIQPLVAANCRKCHFSGGPANSTFESYETTRGLASLMATYAEIRTMPPWPADDTDECTPPHAFKDDMRLTIGEVALLRAWADAGAPAGDAETPAPFDDPVGHHLAEVTHSVGLADAGYSWSVTAEQTSDDYRCFSLDLGLSDDKWLDAVEVVPYTDDASAPSERLQDIVHHVVLFLDLEGTSGDIETDDGGSYSCVGGPGLTTGFTIAGFWAPGAKPFEIPAGGALWVPQGARIVMQLHYHPQGEVNTDASTRLDLHMTDEAPERKVEMRVKGAVVSAPGLQPGPNDADPDAPEFLIPNGAVDHTEEMIIPLPELDGVAESVDVRLWSVFPHMHYVGTDMIVRLQHDAGDDVCLVQTPRWNFDYQYIYQYDVSLAAGVPLRAGDSLYLRCTYTNDATLNAMLAEGIANDALITETTDTRLGEGTLDEMCVVIVGVSYPLQ